MRALLATALPALLLGTAPAAEDEPVLLARHPASFVHALRAWPEPGPRTEQIVGPGWALLHTARETGAMKRLLEVPGVVAVNTRRLSYSLSRLLGVAADTERLYVLVWHSGRVFDSPPAADEPVEGGGYALHAFRLADGLTLPAPPLRPEGLPEAAPPESLEAGPLRLIEGGVRCFGTVARYDGAVLRDD